MLTTVLPVIYRVSSGLAAMLGAGILAGLAPAARASGALLLAGLVLAAFLAILCGLSVVDNDGVLAVLGRITAAAAIAATFGAYLVPDHPVPAAVGLIAVAAVLTATGFRPSRTLTGVAVGVVLGVLVVFVAVCLAIEPPAQVVAPFGSPGTDKLAGVPAAIALMFFGFLGFEHAGGRGRLAVVVTIVLALTAYLAVATAALRQLGGPRLALAPAPLREALAAADAAGIVHVLTVGVTVASLSAILGVFADLHSAGRPLVVPLAGVGAAVGALLLTVPVLMGVTVGLMLCHYALSASRRLQRGEEHQD